jgi:glycosyltransferase involved in cell wall biosynthesis
MYPKVYIIIPTRNRFETLKYAVQTCLNQNYENLEIIISDNASSDNTKNILNEFSDSRLKYQRSETLLPMLYSWEFALSAVKETGFVHFMGDDNGLTIDAVERVVEITGRTKLNIVLSSLIQYTWPNTIVKNGYLAIPKDKYTYIVNSKAALKSTFNLFVGFDRLPTINASFVHTSVINKVRNLFGGKYFIASNPDVCSAIANAFIENEYIYCEIPFVINGASVHSNGMQGGNSSNKSTFVIDNINGGYKYHSLFPPSKSWYLNVYEAYAIVSDHINSKNVKFPKLNYTKLYKKFKKIEYYSLKKYWLYEDLLDFAKNLLIKDNVNKLPEITKITDPTNNTHKLIDSNGSNILFYSSHISIKNVNEVALFCSEILNNYNLIPNSILKPSYINLFRRIIIFKLLLRARKLNLK